MQHWKAVKHLFRYLRGTLDLKLTYRPTPSINAPFVAYTDTDHGGNKDNGRSDWRLPGMCWIWLCQLEQ